MPKLSQTTDGTRLFPWKVSIIYGVIGCVWIFASGSWVNERIETVEGLARFELLKGFSFVIVTAILLWFLCRAWAKKVNHALERYARSRTKYEHYVKSSPISILIFDRKGNLIDANEAATTLTGHPRGDLLKATLADFEAPGGTESELKSIIEEVETSGSYSADHVFRRKDNSLGYLRVDAVALNEKEILCFGRDISEQKASERKLLMLNAMLRAVRRVNQAIAHEKEIEKLLQSVCDILIEDREFRYAWVALFNPKGTLSYFTEAPRHPESGRLKHALDTGVFPKCAEASRREDGVIVSLVPSEECPDFPEMSGHSSTALVCAPFEFDGRLGYIALRMERAAAKDEEEIRLFREVADDLQYALHTILISKEKDQAVNDLIAAKREADQANQAKDEFLAVMSHEMRTPLNPIIGHCHLLQEEIKNPEQKSALDQINASGERLLHLIDDILFFAEIEQNRSLKRTRDFDIFEMCEEAIASARPQPEGLTLSCKIADPTIDPSVYRVVANRETLLRLLQELVNNACKYTREGSVTLSIGVSDIAESSAQYTLKVQDTGIGIDSHLVEGLFAPFTQGDSSYTRKYGGIGLGLAICKKIADLMGGELTVESAPNRGTTFVFQCPLRRVPTGRDTSGLEVTDLPPPDTREAADHAEIRERAPEPEPERGHDKQKILIVEDNPSNAIITRTIIERLGMEPHLATDGSEAVDACKADKFALILMDLSMPVMNGFEATKEILSSSDLNRQTPIVGLTAHVTAEARDECIASGMRAHLAKPFRLAELRSVVERFTEKP